MVMEVVEEVVVVRLAVGTTTLLLQSSLLTRAASLSGVIFFGLPSGISFSSRLGTLDWSKSWSTLVM